MKISGILDTVDDEPHHIHLNLEDFLKNNNNEKTNNKNVLSKANLDLLNNMNNRTSNEKRNIPKNNLITKNKINSNANNKKMNNITTRNAIGKSIRNEDIYENSQIKNKFQNSNSLLMILNENNQKTKKNDKENEGNLKKYVNLNKDPKRINFINENSLKMRKMK